MCVCVRLQAPMFANVYVCISEYAYSFVGHLGNANFDDYYYKMQRFVYIEQLV